MDYPILDFKEGDSYFLGDYVIFICTIVDDCAVVYKYYAKWNKSWEYKVDSIKKLSFNLHIHDLNKKDGL
tara:strand:+ start:322 stop:531 length:210 start_codon:yes stop_codon:yes gene_type:complete